MFGDLFKSMKVPPPSREEFDELMESVLGEEEDGARLSQADPPPTGPDSRDPAADEIMQRSMAANAGFYDELQRELRQRLAAGKAGGPLQTS